MLAFTGQTRSRDWAGRLLDVRLGECCVRGELPPRRAPWFFDNGAYRDYLAGRAFDELGYERDIRRIRLWCDPAFAGVPGWGGRTLPPPLFIVLPDLVAKGMESLAFSESYLTGARAPLGGFPPGVPLYLAVQDGMSIASVGSFLTHHRAAGVDGVFVGGTLPWKIRTGAQWVDVAQRLGMCCHLGRAMSMDRIRWAQRIGADSIDGNAPNFSVEGLDRAERSLAPAPQFELFTSAA